METDLSCLAAFYEIERRIWVFCELIMTGRRMYVQGKHQDERITR